MTCPVPDAHRRLDDTHAEWHDALDAYFDPHRFRRTFNTLLATLQSTVDTISRKKRVVPDGISRLRTWEHEFASSHVHKWADSARNLVIHEADLTLNSVAWVEYTDLSRNLVKRLDVDPATSSEEVIADTLLRHPSTARSGILRISREWIASSLPSMELLRAGAELYRDVAVLVDRFHDGAEGDCSELALPTQECYLPQLKFTACSRMTAALMSARTPVSTTIDISTRMQLVMEVRPLLLGRNDVSTGDELKAMVKERYGNDYLPEGDLIHIAPRHMRLAALFLTVDSEALPWVQLFLDGKRIDAFSVSSGAPGGARMAMFQLIADRIRATKADGVLYTSEIWTTRENDTERKIHEHKETFYDIRPDRGEALAVMAATRDGRQLSMIRDFTRSAEGWPILGRMSTYGTVSAEWKAILAALRAHRI